MANTGRSILSVLIGVVVAGVSIYLAEGVVGNFFSLPEDLEPGDVEALRTAMLDMPASAFAAILAGWGFGALIGGFVAGKLSQDAKRRDALLVGAVLLVLGIANMLMLPHPAWVWAAAVVVFLGGSYLGGMVAART